jgi:hypothetical protein
MPVVCNPLLENNEKIYLVNKKHKRGDMSRTNFENLPVYQLSEKLADKIWEIVADWDYFAKDTAGKQIIKSSDSK